MKSRINKSLAVTIVLFASVSAALCQTLEIPLVKPEDMPALEQLKCTVLLTNWQTTGYSIAVNVSGASYASFDSGTDWKVGGVPFKDGRNDVVVSFTPTVRKGSEFPSGKRHDGVGGLAQSAAEAFDGALFIHRC